VDRKTQAGIHAHFHAISDTIGLPIILHDIPSRTNRELADDTLARLAESQQFIGLRDGTSDITRWAMLHLHRYGRAAIGPKVHGKPYKIEMARRRRS
jgi:dihydrodipicolinate synthase/N-acetylneuraminate lyase